MKRAMDRRFKSGLRAATFTMIAGLGLQLSEFAGKLGGLSPKWMAAAIGGLLLGYALLEWLCLLPMRRRNQPVVLRRRRPDLEGIHPAAAGEAEESSNPDLLILECREMGGPKDRWVLTYDWEGVFGLYDRQLSLELRWPADHGISALPGEFPETGSAVLIVRDPSAGRDLRLEPTEADWARLMLWKPHSTRSLPLSRSRYWEMLHRTQRTVALIGGTGAALAILQIAVSAAGDRTPYYTLAMFAGLSGWNALVAFQAKTNLALHRGWAARRPAAEPEPGLRGA